MKGLLERLQEDLRDPESRYAYADSVTNAFIAAQIRALREERNLTQDKLAELVGTKQSGISRLQKADYSVWKVDTLRKLARAFGVRLRITFEEFGSLPADIGGFSKERLAPRRFEDDPVFQNEARGKREQIASAPGLLNGQGNHAGLELTSASGIRAGRGAAFEVTPSGNNCIEVARQRERVSANNSTDPSDASPTRHPAQIQAYLPAEEISA